MLVELLNNAQSSKAPVSYDNPTSYLDGLRDAYCPTMLLLIRSRVRIYYVTQINNSDATLAYASKYPRRKTYVTSGPCLFAREATPTHRTDTTPIFDIGKSIRHRFKMNV